MVFNGRIIVIAGPTASGKTDASIRVAEELSGEIVVADSMQVYKKMDIGTAKIPLNKRTVTHHCIDLVEPNEPFSSSLYQYYAREAFEKIHNAGNASILSGGTGFYIRSAIDDYSFPEGEQIDNPIREHYQLKLKEEGEMSIWNELKSVDPSSADVIHPNNSKRVIRALELHLQGKSYFDQLNNLKTIPQLFEAEFICIDYNKDALNLRINSRVDKMREKGLIGEVENLLNMGFRESLTATSAIGYKEIVAAFDGNCSIDEAFNQIKLATRRYAKRQRSWFRQDVRYKHIDATNLTNDELVVKILELISN